MKKLNSAGGNCFSWAAQVPVPAAAAAIPARPPLREPPLRPLRDSSLRERRTSASLAVGPEEVATDPEGEPAAPGPSLVRPGRPASRVFHGLWCVLFYWLVDSSHIKKAKTMNFKRNATMNGLDSFVWLFF